MGPNYTEKLDNLNSQFYNVLDDFKKYYVFFNKNPDYNDYVVAYANAKSQLQQINSEIFKIINELEKSSNDLNIATKDIDTKIAEEKKNHDNLINNLFNIKGSNKSAGVMISNYKETYRLKYIKNCTTFAGLFLVFYIIFKVYFKK